MANSVIIWLNSLESSVNHVYIFGLQFKQMDLIVMKRAKARYISVSCQCILTKLVIKGKKKHVQSRLSFHKFKKP